MISNPIPSIFKAVFSRDSGAARGKEFDALYSRFAESPEGKWILGKDDARALARFIAEAKPGAVLELGLGIGASTAVMAQALRGREARITAVEQFEKCIALAKNFIPSPLQEKIEFIHSPPRAFRMDKFSPYLFMSGYENLPVERGPFDFVVVDGPGPWREGERLCNLPNGDLAVLIPYLVPGCKIFIDRRKSSVAILKRFLSRYYALRENNKCWALFERTEKPCRSIEDLEVTDAELEELQKTAYFKP